MWRNLPDYAHDNQVARAYDRGAQFAAAHRRAKIIPLQGNTDLAA